MHLKSCWSMKAQHSSGELYRSQSSWNCGTKDAHLIAVLLVSCMSLSIATL